MSVGMMLGSGLWEHFSFRATMESARGKRTRKMKRFSFTRLRMFSGWYALFTNVMRKVNISAYRLAVSNASRAFIVRPTLVWSRSILKRIRFMWWFKRH